MQLLLIGIVILVVLLTAGLVLVLAGVLVFFRCRLVIDEGGIYADWDSHTDIFGDG